MAHDPNAEFDVDLADEFLEVSKVRAVVLPAALAAGKKFPKGATVEPLPGCDQLLWIRF